MTHDDTPDRPEGPTPEEISARLEALLKRTHALRRAQSAAPPPAMTESGPIWPPPDGDLAEVDVVSVGAAPAETSQASRPDAGADRPVTGAAARSMLHSNEDTAVSPPPHDFGRPDWSTLRLRDAAVEPPRTPAWVWLAIAALVLALGAETAYLLRTAPWAGAGSVQGTAARTRLRVDGAEGLRVRVNDAAPRPLPLDATVDGDDVRVAVETAPSLETVASPVQAAPVGAPAQEAALADGPAGALAAGPTSPAPATGPLPELTSATMGAVRIDSTPAGALVFMEGRERGSTPLTVGPLRPGRHDVIVRGTGWQRELKVDVRASETATLDVAVTPRP